MTTIYLIRHAEAEGNLYRRAQGHYNSLITETGYLQIEALRKRFESVPLDAVYSSDLFRTMTTVTPICRDHGLELTARPDLREVNMGAWEDRTWGDLAHSDPLQMTYFNRTSPLWHAEGGENFDRLRRRISAAVLDIAAAHPGQTVAVGCHGSAIRNAVAVFRGLSIEESASLGHSDNTAVTLVEVENGRARVVCENDNAHLPEGLSTLGRQKWWKHQLGSLADANLRFRPLDMSKDVRRYFEARQEAWLDIHHSMEHFDGDAFVRDALTHWKHDPRSVLCAMLGEEYAGILQLDLLRSAEEGVGYIPFVYMSPRYRKQGMGVQLLGQAVSIYRPLGRARLRLRCAPDNMTAQRFYKRYGFAKIGQAQGTRVPLDLLEKYIGFDAPPNASPRNEV